MLGRSVLFAVGIAVSVATPPASAQQWPVRPVTIIHPFPAGGGGDNVLRSIAQHLTEKLGQPFIVENRTGAGGLVGSAVAARAEPDGYTFILTSTGPAVLNQLLLKTVPYGTEKDFVPVILMGEAPQVIIASPKLGLKTLPDLIAYGRQSAGKLTIGHAGAGSMGHLTAALFLSRAGIEGTLVSYRGAMPVITDVIGGQIDAGVPLYQPPAKGATVLAVTSSDRVSFIPDVPTARESGLDLVAGTWLGMMAPKGTPEAVITKLNGAINAFIDSPASGKIYATNGIRPLGGSPQVMADTIRRDRDLWAPVIEKEGIKLDPQ